MVSAYLWLLRGEFQFSAYLNHSTYILTYPVVTRSSRGFCSSETIGRIKNDGGYHHEKESETQDHPDQRDPLLCGQTGKLPGLLLLEEPKGGLHFGLSELRLPGRSGHDRAGKKTLF